MMLIREGCTPVTTLPIEINEPTQYFTVKELATMLKCSPRLIRRAADRGELVGIRIGDRREWRFSLANVNEWLAKLAKRK
jgi:excisionase family DNA binding protein